jgi:hypothetical protein
MSGSKHVTGDGKTRCGKYLLPYPAVSIFDDTVSDWDYRVNGRSERICNKKTVV